MNKEEIDSVYESDKGDKRSSENNRKDAKNSNEEENVKEIKREYLHEEVEKEELMLNWIFNEFDSLTFHKSTTKSLNVMLLRH